MIALLEAHRAGLLKRAHLMPNIVAGLIVGIVAMPLPWPSPSPRQPPRRGLYRHCGRARYLYRRCTRVQISGSTALHRRARRHHRGYGIAGLQVATMMAGASC
jgi:SulP family sulfate permease